MFTALKVKKIIKQVQVTFNLPQKKISMGSDLYKDLEFDDARLVLANLLYELENKFGFELNDDELHNIEKLRTVRDVVNLVKIQTFVLPKTFKGISHMFTALKVKKNIKQVQATFKLPQKKISMESDLYKDLEFDDARLVLANLLYDLENKFGFEFNDDELHNIEKLRTVRDVVNLVEEHSKRQK